MGNVKFFYLPGKKSTIRDVTHKNPTCSFLGYHANWQVTTPIHQHVINQVEQAGGLAFLAHPYEDALPLFHQTDISCDNWEVLGYPGI